MNIYLDDNLADHALVGLLSKAGHKVLRPGDVGLASVSDARHLENCIRNDFVMLSRDRDDFRDLHHLIQASGGRPPGILIVRLDNDSTRDMKPKHIAAAIRKLEVSGVAFANTIVILNHWR
jgi:predicted nuclease of predicted toxin-antitoxin system